MKKTFIGLVVLGFYVVYSVGIRHERPVLSAPALLAKSSSNNYSSKTKHIIIKPPQHSQQTYKDGTFSGKSEYAYYGNVQVSVTVAGGEIQQVNFLDYPHTHSTSVFINQQAMPYLKEEAIKTQNPNKVQIISGATFTSQGFIESLKSALNKA